MDSTTCNFIIRNRKLFWVFRFTGIFSNPENVGCKMFSYLFISRLCWFIWHVVGTGLSIASYKDITTELMDLASPRKETNISDMTSLYNDSITTPMTSSYFLNEGFYIYIPIILILLLFLGPIQGNIIKVNMERLPQIFKSIQKLDEMKISKCITTITSDEGKDEDCNTQLLNKDLDSTEIGNLQRSISKQEGMCHNCYAKNWIPNVSVIIFIILIVVSTLYVSFKLHMWEDLLDEYILIAIMFYLPLPILTSLFVITLIKEITRLYEAFYENLNEEMFSESKNIEILSTYLSLLQETVETMMNNVFEFTLGINFAIFVTSTVMCSYELVEGLKEAQVIDDGKGHQYRNLISNFGEIDYILPLFVCLLFMFWICQVSNHLMTNVHAKIRLRIRCLLPKLSGKPFKELKFLYITIKDLPPQVYIYGGWQVNYQLLSGIVLFTTTYARFSL